VRLNVGQLLAISTSQDQGGGSPKPNENHRKSMTYPSNIHEHHDISMKYPSSSSIFGDF
jgi:hypothetical protein